MVSLKRVGGGVNHNQAVQLCPIYAWCLYGYGEVLKYCCAT